MKNSNKIFIAAIAMFSLVACNNPNVDDSGTSEPSSSSETIPTYNYSLSFIDNGHSIEKGTTQKLKTKLLNDGEEFNDYTVKFSSLDNIIATINDNGLVTAVAEGETKIKAVVNEYECEPAYYSISVFAKYYQMDILNENIVNYYGRVLKTGNKVNLYNTGSAFEVTFSGTTLNARFDKGVGQKIRIYLDGEDLGTKYVKDVTSLASGLEDKEHTIKVVRVNYEARGVMTLGSISGAKYYITAPKKPELKFEFIGDSLTAGYGVNSDGSGDTISNEDGTVTYAYKTMLHYGAQANFLSYSGVSVALPIWVDWLVPDRYTQYSFTTETTKWDTSLYQPDYVVINLGTNDSGALTTGIGSTEELTTRYLVFLQNLRSYYKDAIIVASYGLAGLHEGTALAISNAVTKTFDNNIHYFEFKPVDCSGHNGHPSIDGQTDGANQLIKYIDTLTYNDQPVKESYEISEVTDFTYKEDHKTYAIKVTEETNTVVCKLNVQKANQEFVGGITVKNGNSPVHVSTAKTEEWFKPEGDTTDGYQTMGSWVRYSDKSDDSNLIYFKINAETGKKLAVGTTVYVSIIEYREPEEGIEYSITRTDEVTYETYDVYKIEILLENEGFIARIDTGKPNTALSGAIYVTNSERWISVETENYSKWFRASYQKVTGGNQ